MDIRSEEHDGGVWTRVSIWSGPCDAGVWTSEGQLAKSLDEAEAAATGIIELPADPGCAQLDQILVRLFEV